MREKQLNTNKSKKLIIGVSILFLIVILIIGTSLAFFTQSDTKELGNIVSTNINESLKYTDNNDYMLGNLIPINVSDINKAYTRENNLKCKDDNGYNVCSIYNFTITNNANVTQSLIIDLYPVVNSFHNLRFNLYDITNNELLISNKELKYDDKTNISLDSLLLNNTNNKSKTYELVFYIENKPEEDQTSLDAGKSFGATIKVNSITTGYNIVRDLGTGCWKADENDSTILSEFTGYTDKNENGKFDETDELKTECEMYFKKDIDNYYIVNIPSTYGGYTFKSLGNNLFNALGEYQINKETQEETFILNEYSKIKNITINEGIEEIEDGFLEQDEEGYMLDLKGTFIMLGAGIEDDSTKLNVYLSNTLTKIGDFSFAISNLTKINIPENIEKIGVWTFTNNKLTEVIVSDKVKSIGDYAFSSNNIQNLVLSSSLQTIGHYAFSSNNIQKLFIPSSVQTIGNSAFRHNYDLTKVTFEDTLDNPSQLKIIGEDSFFECDLTYDGTSEKEYLQLPASIEEIGSGAFSHSPGNHNLKFIRFKGTREQLDLLENNWYGSGVIVKAKDEQ